MHENGELRQFHAFVSSSVRTERSDDAAASWPTADWILGQEPPFPPFYIHTLTALTDTSQEQEVSL